MKRVCVIVGGKVQKVGYRDLVERETFGIDIKGYVENIDDGKVRIVAEGPEELLEAFISRINVIRYPVYVAECDASWQDATGEFKEFEIIRGDMEEETFERLDYAGKLLYENLAVSKENLAVSKETLENSRVTIRLQNNMLDKQDQMLNKQDQMIDIAKETKDEIVEFRKDTGKYLDEEFKEIRQELVSIKNALEKAGIKV